jgi:hypothetical protein
MTSERCHTTPGLPTSGFLIMGENKTISLVTLVVCVCVCVCVCSGGYLLFTAD